MRASKITTTEHFDKCVLAELQSKGRGQAAGNTESYLWNVWHGGYCLLCVVSSDRSASCKSQQVTAPSPDTHTALCWSALPVITHLEESRCVSVCVHTYTNISHTSADGNITF